MINLIPKNSSNACVLPKVKQSEMHPLTGEDVPRSLDAIRNDPFNDLFFVALFTGIAVQSLLLWFYRRRPVFTENFSQSR